MVIAALLFNLHVPPVNADYIFDDVETLQGITSFFVYVHSLPPQAEVFGLSREKILSDVETQLRQAGITVVSYGACCDTPGSPYLFVGVGLINDDQGDRYAATVHLALRQVCSLERKPELSYHATTWMRGETVLVEAASLAAAVQDLLDGWVNMFIYDYRSANKRKEGTP